jgi:hypothetical protein
MGHRMVYGMTHMGHTYIYIYVGAIKLCMIYIHIYNIYIYISTQYIYIYTLWDNI